MGYQVSKDGIFYELGASVQDVTRGDVIKVGPNRLEVITKISPMSGSGWNKQIETESGRVCNMWDVLAYGKRVNK